MNIRQAIYEKSEPPKDRPILARFKPTSWPHHVIWNGEAWQLVRRGSWWGALQCDFKGGSDGEL